MSVFRSEKALAMARRVKRFLRHPVRTVVRKLKDPKIALRHRLMRSKRDEFRQLKSEVRSRRQEEYRQFRDEISKIENEINGIKKQSKRIGKELRAADDPTEISALQKRKDRIQRERSRLRDELRSAKREARATNIGRKKRKKTIQQEIFQLERERRSAGELRAGNEGSGTLPDFLIIGAKKAGTTYLYHLLTQHPLAEPAASKELHFFDVHFDLGVEWYRRFFSTPRWEDGRRTITGEATPYISHALAPERVAQVVPNARLIALLRDPVERAYSDYQMVARKDREHQTFEEAVGAAENARPSGEEYEATGRNDRTRPGHARHGYLSRSIYIDQLLRWSEFFPREQLLVLKSEDFFEDPAHTLEEVLEFLGLPQWEPEAEVLEGGKRNAGNYEQEMAPSTRRRLEEYFESHNRRLYDFLGVDLGW